MDFGFVFFGSVNVYPAVALAEKRGFTHAWLYDSQMLASDVYAALALCAVNTKKIHLGPGVTNPASRIAPMTASAIASINALAPGRTILGIGTGNTARRTLGMPAARLDVLREHIRVCRDLLAGKTTPYQEGERRRMIKFLNPKSGAINIQKKVPIYVAASGPKTLELAGEIADGVILFGAVSPSLINFCLNHVRAGAERAGRNPKKIYSLCMTAFHLTNPGEKLEIPRVRKAVGPFVTSSSNIFAFSCPNPDDLPADLRDDLVAFKNAYRAPDEPIETRHLKLYSGYLQGFKKEHEPLVTEKMIHATTLTGTREEVMDSIRAMQKAGISQVAIQAVTDPTETIETFAKEIIRRWK
ncbi:MAG TPA: LLM class flavin-dependent oxidoreductase [Methylomirabilota bacterium]|jgi:alkanesulfonate monooxygenase SsuD/methylene tetrahydromethanopterin reductase-like flavin-dependent oxidoreductase (luciferase family)|nr:LLM class flavin-dependent oxidoreductase [Methylomirabilota bacterium]